MTLEFTVLETLVLAIAVLFVGGLLQRGIAPLRTYNIPVPVIGGLVFAALSAVLFTRLDVSIDFDMALRGPLMLAFFTTIGLGANLRLLAQGGVKLLIFLAVVGGFLLVQNGVGLAAALGLDLHPLVGLLSGSITLSGGHGTGAAYAQRFMSDNNLRGAMELALACATFGLIIGGIIGGPLAQRLIKRHALAPDPAQAQAGTVAVAGGKVAAELSPASFLRSLFLIAVCVLAGEAVVRLMEGAAFTLPAFVWALFAGIFIRNLGELTGLYRVDDTSVTLIGGVSLSLFLAMALMSLRLWELASLAGSMLAILVVQTVALAVYAYFVTFRVMGRDYDAAVMCGGHCGFGMGATPTAVANMEAVTARYGPSPQAFLLIPMVGAFFIDIANALVITLFLSLPMFGF